MGALSVDLMQIEKKLKICTYIHTYLIQHVLQSPQLWGSRYPRRARPATGAEAATAEVDDVDDSNELNTAEAEAETNEEGATGAHRETRVTHMTRVTWIEKHPKQKRTGQAREASAWID